ncbi:hypothetical protein D1872_325470 [compost metagenome]
MVAAPHPPRYEVGEAEGLENLADRWEPALGSHYGYWVVFSNILSGYEVEPLTAHYSCYLVVILPIDPLDNIPAGGPYEG